MMIGKILFGKDWDGTCVNTTGRLVDYSSKMIKQYFGGSYSDAEAGYKSTYGKAFPLQLSELFPDASDELIEECARVYDEKKWNGVYEGARLFDGTKDALRGLSETGILGVCTGNTAELTQRMARENDVLKYISFIRGKAEGKKPQHMIWAAKRYNPDKTLVFIGDAPSDVKLSRDNDIKSAGYDLVSIGVTGGLHTEEQLMDAGASHVITPEEIYMLPEVVKEVNLSRLAQGM